MRETSGRCSAENELEEALIELTVRKSDPPRLGHSVRLANARSAVKNYKITGAQKGTLVTW